MREGTNEYLNERTNERTYTMTKHITTLLLHSRVKIGKTGESKVKKCNQERDVVSKCGISCV